MSEPVTLKTFAKYVEYHNAEPTYQDNLIQVILPDGTKAYVTSICSTNGKTTLSLVTEQVQTVKTYVPVY